MTREGSREAEEESYGELGEDYDDMEEEDNEVGDSPGNWGCEH